MPNIQELNDDMTKKLGFFRSIYDSALGLSTEVGELQDIIRKWEGGKKVKSTDKPVTKDDIANEIADVIVYLGQIATYYGIDIEEAFFKKVDIITKRKFKDEHGGIK